MQKNLPNTGILLPDLIADIVGSAAGEGDLAKAGELRAPVFAALEDRLNGKHWRDILPARKITWLEITIARRRSKTMSALISAVDAAVNKARVENIIDAQAQAAIGTGERPPDPRAAAIVLAGLDRERFGRDAGRSDAPTVTINIGGGIDPRVVAIDAKG